MLLMMRNTNKSSTLMFKEILLTGKECRKTPLEYILSDTTKLLSTRKQTLQKLATKREQIAIKCIMCSLERKQGACNVNKVNKVHVMRYKKLKTSSMHSSVKDVITRDVVDCKKANIEHRFINENDLKKSMPV